MSIINDALKKVEKSFAYGYPAAAGITPTGHKKIRTNKYLIYALVFVFGLFLENTYFLFFFHPERTFINSPASRQTPDKGLLLSSQQQQLPTNGLPETPPAAAAEASYPPVPDANEIKETKEIELVLNGIFFSQDKSFYALINNKIVKEGDDIEGAIVRKIDSTDVELESAAGKLIKLSQGR